MTTTSYKVTGMTCQHCANAVTSELRGLDGVSAVTPDHVRRPARRPGVSRAIGATTLR
ncbi:MAG TPA: heavy-metal-associated domain-containing protein [Trebonia sp.]